MSQHSQEIMQLQNEVRALKQSVTTLCMQLQATTQLATALAATHPNKALALEVFNQVTESANGPLQYSTTPDADLEVLERIYSMYRAVLGAA